MNTNLTKLTDKAFAEAMERFEADHEFGYVIDLSDNITAEMLIGLVDLAAATGMDSYYQDDELLWFFTPEETESLTF